MAEPTRWKKFWESFGLGLILTLIGIGLIIVPRFCDVWALLRTGRLNELGDFLAGVFTPVALGWLVYGYFLQKTELGLQRQELQQTRETLGQQVKVLQEQAAAERQRSRPDLSLRQERMDGGVRRTFVVRNLRAPARNLEVTCWEDGGPPEEKKKFTRSEIFGPGQEFSFPITDAPAHSTDSYASFITACFLSERHEKLYQCWEITRARGIPPATIQEITTGPDLLKEGESPPLPN